MGFFAQLERGMISARLRAGRKMKADPPDLHRRGFGRALLEDGLRQFAAAGMTYAIAGVEVGNSSAEVLYRSVGFRLDRALRVYEQV